MIAKKKTNNLAIYNWQSVTIAKGSKLIRGTVACVKSDGRFTHEDDHGHHRDCHISQIIVASL